MESSELITLVYFNPQTRCLQYNPNITRLGDNALFADNDGIVYRIVYYNHKARVAFAILKEENANTRMDREVDRESR